MSTESRSPEPLMDIMAILRFLPHRFPFLLVDRVESIHRASGNNRVGTKVLAIKNVTINEPFFQGHFPHRPVMPGVLQLEAMAQVAALACIDTTGPKMDFAIASIDKAKFRKPVVPGDTLRISVEVIRDRVSMIAASAQATVNDQVVCECEFLAKMFTLIDSTQGKSLGASKAEV